jgi:hypothetical protein
MFNDLISRMKNNLENGKNGTVMPYSELGKCNETKLAEYTNCHSICHFIFSVPFWYSPVPLYISIKKILFYNKQYNNTIMMLSMWYYLY